MELRYADEQLALRAELREYFAGLMTDERRAGLETGDDYGDGVAYKEIVRQLGKDGWLTIGWPKEYGGAGRGPLDQSIFADEASAARVPVPFLTVNTVGPTIMRYGSEEQRSYYLPKISAGELHCSVGYSEPGAGTDLASLRTTAVLDGDEWVINGQKMWTSLIRYADYVWLACRTEPDAPAHKAISMLLVPTTAEGFSWTPVHTMAGPTTSATYFENVRVPKDALIGERGRGWSLITNQLNEERVALSPSAPLSEALRAVLDWARETGAIEREWVRANLAEVHAKTEVLRLMNLRIAAETEQVKPANASATKIYGTELSTEGYRLLMEVLGARSVVRTGSADALLRGRVERMHRASLILTFGGGTNEIQRDIIGGHGLGLPLNKRR
ncbi:MULTISPECIES: acyl-CoA dehydrogenase family protein [Sciscionella]|uniref:acyl-CoA dehydrogenase family protein n=1 Tax=Sciscionella TaxID=596495 RepID=UPI00035F1989|nr:MULTISPECIES: acyl-CoA dehydrogenase family protein [Sciscionella]